MSESRKIKSTVCLSWPNLPWSWQETSLLEDDERVRNIEVTVSVEAPAWLEEKVLEFFLLEGFSTDSLPIFLAENGVSTNFLKYFPKKGEEAEEFGEQVVSPIMDRLMEFLPGTVDFVESQPPEVESPGEGFEGYPDCDKGVSTSITLMAHKRGD